MQTQSQVDREVLTDRTAEIQADLDAGEPVDCSHFDGAGVTQLKVNPRDNPVVRLIGQGTLVGLPLWNRTDADGSPRPNAQTASKAMIDIVQGSSGSGSHQYPDGIFEWIHIGSGVRLSMPVYCRHFESQKNRLEANAVGLNRNTINHESRGDSRPLGIDQFLFEGEIDGCGNSALKLDLCRKAVVRGARFRNVANHWFACEPNVEPIRGSECSVIVENCSAHNVGNFDFSGQDEFDQQRGGPAWSGSFRNVSITRVNGRNKINAGNWFTSFDDVSIINHEPMTGHPYKGLTITSRLIRGMVWRRGLIAGFNVAAIETRASGTATDMYPGIVFVDGVAVERCPLAIRVDGTGGSVMHRDIDLGNGVELTNRPEQLFSLSGDNCCPFADHQMD